MTASNQDRRDDEMQAAVERIVSLTWRGPGEWYSPDAAPNSDDYDGDTEPGSPWDEACDRLLAKVRAVLPAGWEVQWSDNDLTITDTGRRV